jgi:hypothetical protein
LRVDELAHRLQKKWQERKQERKIQTGIIRLVLQPQTALNQAANKITACGRRAAACGC